MIRIKSQSGSHQFFPAGYTLKQYEANFPNWKKMPDIHVTWYWNTKKICIKAFGLPHSFDKPFDFWDKITYPYTYTRNWGDIDESKETTVERFGKYCKFNIHADRVVVKYNGEILHDGKLESEI